MISTALNRFSALYQKPDIKGRVYQPAKTLGDLSQDDSQRWSQEFETLGYDIVFEKPHKDQSIPLLRVSAEPKIPPFMPLLVGQSEPYFTENAALATLKGRLEKQA